MRFLLPSVFVLCLCVSTFSAEPAVEKDNDAASRAVNAQLDRTLPEVNFEGVALGDVVDFLRDVSGTDILVDWKKLESAKVDHNAPVKLHLKNQKFRDVLDGVLEAAAGKGKIVYQVQGNEIFISTKEGVAAAGVVNADVSRWDEKTKVLMARRLPEVNFDGPPLKDVVDFLNDVSGTKIVVDWDRFPKDGLKPDSAVSLKLRNAPLGDVIRQVFKSVTETPVDISSHDGMVHIGPAAKPDKPLDDKPAK